MKYELATIDTMIATLHSLKDQHGGNTKVRISHPLAPGEQNSKFSHPSGRSVTTSHTIARVSGKGTFVVLQARPSYRLPSEQ